MSTSKKPIAKKPALKKPVRQIVTKAPAKPAPLPQTNPVDWYKTQLNGVLRLLAAQSKRSPEDLLDEFTDECLSSHGIAPWHLRYWHRVQLHKEREERRTRIRGVLESITPDERDLLEIPQSVIEFAFEQDPIPADNCLPEDEGSNWRNEDEDEDEDDYDD